MSRRVGAVPAGRQPHTAPAGSRCAPFAPSTHTPVSGYTCIPVCTPSVHGHPTSRTDEHGTLGISSYERVNHHRSYAGRITSYVRNTDKPGNSQQHNATRSGECGVSEGRASGSDGQHAGTVGASRRPQVMPHGRNPPPSPTTRPDLCRTRTVACRRPRPLPKHEWRLTGCRFTRAAPASGRGQPAWS